MPHRVSGQWIGQSLGDPDATIVLDLDPIGTRAVGHAYLYPDDPSLPSSYAKVETDDKLLEFGISAEAIHFDSEFGFVPTPEQLADRYPGGIFPTKVDAKFLPTNTNQLTVEWKTEIGTNGKGTLERPQPMPRSALASEVTITDWRSFQDFVTNDTNAAHAYRGQSFPWPLQTSFHRTSRRDLRRYLYEDLPRLHRALTGRTKHIFDLSKPQENGAFLNLAQHHGFPTPLLDWTYSPFVAAYFAYSSVSDELGSDPVRILAFDQAGYSNQYRQYPTLTLTLPHLSILEALSIGNDRAVPQQGLLTLTNLQDIEGYVALQERRSGRRFLRAFDLPRHEKKKALSDLRLMGITQTTLFPGLESICSDHRSQFF